MFFFQTTLSILRFNSSSFFHKPWEKAKCIHPIYANDFTHVCKIIPQLVHSKESSPSLTNFLYQVLESWHHPLKSFMHSFLLTGIFHITWWPKQNTICRCSLTNVLYKCKITSQFLYLVTLMMKHEFKMPSSPPCQSVSPLLGNYLLVLRFFVL